MALKSQEVFDKMAAGISQHGAAIIEKVGSVYAFEIRPKKGAKATLWTVDLKNGKGAVAKGKIDGVKADATFVMLDDDFVQLAMGKLNPQTAFMKGKMKIKGNMKAALKFKPDMIPKDAAL